jgi:phosphate transport system permease protein
LADHGRDICDRQCAPHFRSPLAPGTTISATIANEFTEAVGDLYTSALIALGLILFVITFIVLAIARLLLLRLNARVGA